jgi:hypothetical protein
MPNGDVAQPVSWKVIGVNPSVDITGGGNPVTGNTITYQTGLGHRGSVFVPNNASVPDGVKAIVREAATRTDALATMSE